MRGDEAASHALKINGRGTEDHLADEGRMCRLKISLITNTAKAVTGQRVRKRKRYSLLQFPLQKHPWYSESQSEYEGLVFYDEEKREKREGAMRRRENLRFGRPVAGVGGADHRGTDFRWPARARCEFDQPPKAFQVGSVETINALH